MSSQHIRNTEEEKSTLRAGNQTTKVRTTRLRTKPLSTPPTVEEVRDYAASRGYPDFDAEKFIEYYTVADWCDSKGNQVHNWKQKFLAVWAKNAGNGSAEKREPQPGDPDWLPTEEYVDQVLAKVGPV